ncbi:MAG: aldo/keto reductase [Anaerolineae bacterium]|nr:aldo/keto reductase [Anaerolineae bacterium]
MRTVTLGHTGEQVSALCLGAMFFGTKQDQATSFSLLDQYVEAGGTFIDTANIYAHWVPGGEGGESETILGAWLKARGNCDDLFIASKVGFGYGNVPTALTPDLIEAECDKSLQRLGIDTIDLYYAHVDDRHTPLRDTLEAFNRLVASGKVRYIGASNYLAYRLERAHLLSKQEGWADFCSLQQRYTYLQPRYGMNMGMQQYVTAEIRDYVRARGDFTLLAYSVLLAGAYTRSDRAVHDAYKNPDNEARLLTLQAVARESGATANQVVLAWMMQSDPAVLPLIAASTTQQMAENIGALDITLSAEQMTRLNEARA